MGLMTPYLPYISGNCRWAGRNSTGITISYGASKDLILVHTVQLKPMIKAYLVSIGISDVVIASVHSEKTCEEVDDEDNDYYYYE